MAAAIGAGLPSTSRPHMIVRHRRRNNRSRRHQPRGIVIARSIRIGGDEMDADIVAYARASTTSSSRRTAEDIKIAIGSASPGEWTLSESLCVAATADGPAP